MTNGELMRKEDATTHSRENARKLIFSIQTRFRTFKIVIYVIFVDAHWIMTSLTRVCTMVHEISLGKKNTH